ncbi:MAG TPA: CocE/NonD family hydrolase [Chloroflexota bacterium]|nr:CocE/NonD family hydrolase [Chloroflexota bacterium]
MRAHQCKRVFRGQLLAALGPLLGLALLALPAAAAAAETTTEPKPFGHACKAQEGVRFCPTVGLSERVPTWDGVPIDVDVTLPATGNGPWPTIAALHGWGTKKTEFEALARVLAARGYAVMTDSHRGWARSCGSEESRERELPPGSSCAKGWVHMADTRYENRDTEYLLGLLADEGIAVPRSIGVMGASYGAGQSIELAYLKNRVRLPDGSFIPWTSPKGKKMEIKAAWPIAPWSDLVDALEPNGRFLDTEIAPHGQSYEPFGVLKQSIDAALYAEGPALEAYYAPEGMDPEADITKWYQLANAGEPWTPEDEAVAHQVYDYHQAYGMPLSGQPAALLLECGWTDDIFPPEQCLRVYNQVRALKSYAALMVGDVGHQRASNKPNEGEAYGAEALQFFAAKLKREGQPPKNGSVNAFTSTCPLSTPAGGPYVASNWSKLATHAVTIGSSAAQTFTSAGASPTIAAEFDTIGEIEKGGANVCKETKSELEPNTATYTTTSPGFLMLGLPTITAHVSVVGPYGQIDTRLWDVLPSGQEILITEGVYSLTENQTGTIKFQLNGNGYEFAKGDTVKLELMGRDAPQWRASNAPFTVEVSDLSALLPAK